VSTSILQLLIRNQTKEDVTHKTVTKATKTTLHSQWSVQSAAKVVLYFT